MADLFGLLEELGRAEPLPEGVLLLYDTILGLDALVAPDVKGFGRLVPFGYMGLVTPLLLGT